MPYRLSVFVGRLLFLLVVGFFISSTSVFGQTGSIGNRVWNDLDGDGIQDTGETGVDGVTVSLYDGTMRWLNYTTTSGGGAYSFTNLAAGDYILKFKNFPAGYSISPQDQGGDDAVDSDANTTTGNTATISLSSGEVDNSVDCGISTNSSVGSIGNFVWNDTDGDGIQDAGESGVDGVTVSLYDGTMRWLNYTTTSGGGAYSFTDLTAGDYILKFKNFPAGYSISPQDQGGDDSADSDANPTTGNTATINLSSGEVDNSVDCGISTNSSGGSISNFVWIDTDADGIQDGGETGYNGVTVTLYQSDGTTVISSTTTAGGGLYSFTSLSAGSYVVGFTLPAGYSFSTQDQGGDDAIDSDANTSTGKTVTITLSTDENNTSIDCGLVVNSTTGTIGNIVWNDTDGDGIQDGGESGVDGVTVSLYNGTMRWLNYTTTSGGGAYSFTGLAAGDYILRFKNFPAGYTISPQDQGGDDAVDSDANTTTGNTATINLSSGEVDNSVDCGISNNSSEASISNFVWDDTNGDGIQDAGETGVDGVTVTLYESDGSTVISSTSTSGGGNYSFTALTAGDYIVGFTLPNSNYGFSDKNQGGDNTKDSDADTSIGKTGIIAISSGTTNRSIDCGMFQYVKIIGNIFDDYINKNGINIYGFNRPYPMCTVTLYESDGTTVVSTTNHNTSVQSSNYWFVDIRPGTYIIGFNLYTHWIFSPKDQGNDDTKDSDADPVTGKTDPFTINSGDYAGSYKSDIDCGAYRPISTYGNRIWNDLNKNGIQDSGEPGIDGVEVIIFDVTGSEQSRISSDGGYFRHKLQFNYDPVFVKFILPAGKQFSPKDQGSDDTLDSDVNSFTGISNSIPNPSGEWIEDISCGMYNSTTSGGISNLVWVDTDADGIQDAGEDFSNVDRELTVTLYQSDGTTIISSTTTINGFYNFYNLSAGSYIVGFTLPTGYTFSPQDQGGDDSVDSDANTSTGKTEIIALSSGENNTSIDCGLYIDTAIGNIVWNDTDGDGIQDGGESGVDGVTVSLYDGTMRWLNYTTTSGGGAYSFTNLTAGDYILKFKNFPSGYTISPQDQGGDDSADSDANPTTGNTATINLSSGEVDNSVDCGISTNSPSASISNAVWNDTDSDGIQDGGESGLNGVSVTLYQSDGTTVISTITTAGGGLYSFNSLSAGSYVVGFTLPYGYVFSPLNQGGDDTVDNDVERTSAKTTAITLSSGESDTSVDCGMVYGASINGWVWNDTDNDGIQDAGETTGIAGVTVNFYQHDGVTVDATTTTLSDGSYNLTTTNNTGNHRMGFVLPSGYSYSPHNVGSNDLIDSDPDPSTGYGYSFNYDGMTIYSKDAGMYPSPNTIGNLVWDDSDSDGIQDAGEIGLNDVTVTLYESDGTTVVSTTTTAEGGIYSFSSLTDGSYIIAYTPPTDYSISLQNQGGDDTKDSDANTGTGKTSLISLSGGETDNTNDCGLINSGTASISNFIWDDADYDGIQDGGETGIDGVTVTLYQSDGSSVITTTSTAGGGSYSFLNLAAGNYIIGVTRPAGKEFSPQDQGGDDDLDSDLNQSTGKTSAIILSSGETNTSIDCGLLIAISISGIAWRDTNENGVNSGGELPLDGSTVLTVKLYESDGTTLLQTTSTSYGVYSFSVSPGSYIVEFSELSGYSFSPMDNSNVDSNDSDVNPSTGKTGVITVSAGSSNTTTDCGIYETGYSFTNCLVWDDLNMDGIQDAGEPGIDGIEVTLYKWYHAVGYEGHRTTTTSGGGLYSFAGLTDPADPTWPYGIRFTMPNEYDTFSPKDQGSDDTKDSDVSYGFKGDLSFTSSTISNIDCGMYNSVTAPSISNFVWNDSNANGIQDPEESGINGITVSLYSGTDTWIDYTTTSGNGSYDFSSLAPGDYKVRFLLPSGYVFSPKNQGSDDTKDSDVNSATMKTDVFTLSAGDNNRTIDCGLIADNAISIGNKVWLDTEYQDDTKPNGIQDDGESGINGVTVSLYSGTDKWLNYTTTSGGGLYSFTGLTPGSYKVRFLLPSGYVYCPINQGGDDTKDSDVNYSTMKTDVFTLTAGANTTVDCGLVQGIAFNGKVWKDTDFDGIMDSGETGLYGVRVTLYESDGTTHVATTHTANYDPQLRGGNYNFTVGESGTYIVKFILPSNYSFSPQNVGGDDTKDSDVNTSTGKTAAITLSVGEMSNNLDCGLINNGTASISNFVWEDTDDDGIQDGGETGVNGVTVSLYHGDGTWLNYTTTSGGGLYSFTGLAAGIYKVRFKNFPDNYSVGPINQGGDDTKDSDVNPSTGYTAYFPLGSGVNDTSVDCGLDYDIDNGPIIRDRKINTAGPDELGINTEIGKSVSIYPNPSRLGYFKLLLNDFEGKTNIKIVDIQGRVAKSFDVFDTGEITIGTSDQKVGTYFIIITNNNKSYTKKIIVLD